MYKKVIMLLVPLMLQGCPSSFSSHEPDNTDYFSDASTCYQSSLRKGQIKVPTAKSMTVVEVPITNDPAAFNTCMEYKGHPAATVDPDTYMDIARECRKTAHHAENPDHAYADCVKHGNITVEAFPKEKPDTP